MTDLQISLLAIGGVLVVSVFLFNKWQEYKARKLVDSAFADGHDDVLMRSEESNVAALAEEAHPEPSLFGAAVEGSPTATIEAPASSSVMGAPPAIPIQEEGDLPVDSLVDCVVALELETPIKGEKILHLVGDLKFAGRKPMHFMGQNLEGRREALHPQNGYGTLFAGIQMVNRGGPLTELEYSEFIARLRPISDQLNAYADIPDMNKVMIHARELHQFVAEHDAQLSLSIASNGAPWTLSALLAALEKQGFDVRPDGRLAMPDGEGGTLFSLSTNVSVSESVTPRLTLLLDVPCVAPERDAFGAMSACARTLAARLGGTIVDDGNRQISREALDEIAGQVREFYAAMLEAQIPAGSLRAQRLFS